MNVKELSTTFAIIFHYIQHDQSLRSSRSCLWQPRRFQGLEVAVYHTHFVDILETLDQLLAEIPDLRVQHLEEANEQKKKSQ